MDARYATACPGVRDDSQRRSVHGIRRVLLRRRPSTPRFAEATGGAEIRLGIDAVGGFATGRPAGCLCPGAILLSYGRMSGEPCSVQPEAVIFRDLAMRGLLLASWFLSTPAHERDVVVGEVARLIATGELHAPIPGTYDVSEIKDAVAAAASCERSGEVLTFPPC